MGPQAGQASLRIEAGSAIDPSTGEFVKLGLPYGEKPRLVLIHLASEAVRNSSAVVDVEDSMTAFARSLGMETNGQQLRSLKDQLARLAASTVRMGIIEEGRAVQVHTQIVSAFDLWFPKQADQRVLWPSTVRLSEEYFQSLGSTPCRSTTGRLQRWRRRRWPWTCTSGWPSGCTACRRASRSSSPGQRCMSSSARDSPASATSAAASSRRCTRSSAPIRRPAVGRRGGLTLQHSPPPVAPRSATPGCPNAACGAVCAMTTNP